MFCIFVKNARSESAVGRQLWANELWVNLADLTGGVFRL